MTVRVTQLVDELSDKADQEYLPACENRKGAVAIYSGFNSLDDFHAHVPIGCLEEFEIVLLDNAGNPVVDEEAVTGKAAGKYVLVSDDAITGPYTKDEAFELSYRGGGQPVPFSIVRHSLIMYNRLVSLSRQLAELTGAAASAIAWAEGQLDP